MCMRHICLKGHKLKKVSQTCLPDWACWLTVNANISLIFVGLPMNGTDSNNCKHLGSLQALHLDPRGSSPGTGGPAQLPLPHKSRSEREDYLSSPRRDMATGILSDCFTLIIGTGWQGGENADIYHKCSTRKHDCGINKLSRSSSRRKVCSCVPCLPFLSFSLHHRAVWPIRSARCWWAGVTSTQTSIFAKTVSVAAPLFFSGLNGCKINCCVQQV